MWLGGVAQAADCSQSASLDDFVAASAKAEEAFASMDIVTLSAVKGYAMDLLPCLDAKVTTREAATFHRMVALAAFTAGDEDLVLAEYHAARRLEPGYAIPEDVVPPGHRLRELYDQSVDADEGELHAMMPPTGGHLVVDGIRGAPRPDGISVIVQVFDAEGTLAETVLLEGGEPTPSWAPELPAPLPPPPVEPEPEPSASGSRGRTVTWIATGVAAAAAGGLYFAASEAHTEYYESGLVGDEREAIRKKNNTLFFSSVGAGVLAAGLGVTATVAF